jgi:hypothetical protein
VKIVAKFHEIKPKIFGHEKVKFHAILGKKKLGFEENYDTLLIT